MWYIYKDMYMVRPHFKSLNVVIDFSAISFLSRIDTCRFFKFCFPSSRNGDIYLYIVTFSSCHYFFPQLEWYAELLGMHCSAWLLLFAICAALLGFFWLQWWLLCCMCVHIIVTFTNDLFTFYTLIYIDYIFFSKYISSEMWLSSHTQACGFFATNL